MRLRVEAKDWIAVGVGEWRDFDICNLHALLSDNLYKKGLLRPKNAHNFGKNNENRTVSLARPQAPRPRLGILVNNAERIEFLDEKIVQVPAGYL